MTVNFHFPGHRATIIQYGCRLDLQFFADGPGGEKTEDATQKKLSDARSEGQVAKSKEMATAFGLISLFLVLKLWAGNLGNRLMGYFATVYNRIPELLHFPNGNIQVRDLGMIVGDIFQTILVMIWPVFLVGVTVAFVTDLVQVKWKPTSKPMRFKFSKLNPLTGIKKIISPQSLVELVKSILKILLIGYVTYSTFKEDWMFIYSLYDVPLREAIAVAGMITLDFGIKVSVIYLLIAAADYIYQKRKFKKDMKMTKQEVKDEYKNSEGNPEIKGKIRQKMMEVSRRRMMQDVPKADVVITNPVHYAVAVRYNAEESPAPVVVAKGENQLAQRIKETAKENHVEIVENRPLARMLYHNVEVGEQVPPELYQAVAEVLAFVYKLNGRV